MEKPQLQMVLASLDRVPEVVIPGAYVIRTYRPGDGAVWCRLINDAIGGEYTEERFEQEMSGAPGLEPADLFFAVSGDAPAGTAWARRAKQRPEQMGYVHMVAVAPEHRGRGLGRALVLSVLRRFREVGLASAMLETDDIRLPAIRLYLGLGFRPAFTHESHAERWRRVRRELGPGWKEVGT
jgi:mycothiol synthase